MSRNARSVVPFAVGFAVFLNTAQADEATTTKSKPTVYIHIIKENDPQDKAVENAYAKKFTIVEVRDSKQFTKAVLKDYVHPRPEVNGRVTVEMIVTSNGRVVEPFILQSADGRLNMAALNAVRKWRFAPARLNGSPVSETCWAAFRNDKETMTGVDVEGFRHSGSALLNDLIVTSRPVIPSSVRSGGYSGSGLLRLTLDLKTGSVTRVAIVRSTGFPEYDKSAIEAFREWRWKPGTWKEIDVPLMFGPGSREGMTIGPP